MKQKKRSRSTLTFRQTLSYLLDSPSPAPIMDTQQLLRAAIVAIVLIGALVLLGVILNLAIPFLSVILKFLLVALLLVMVVRFVTLWSKERR